MGLPRLRSHVCQRNQSHACAPLGDLNRHFVNASPVVLATFDRVLAEVRSLGPVEVLPETTRMALLAESYRAGAQEHRSRGGR